LKVSWFDTRANHGRGDKESSEHFVVRHMVLGKEDMLVFLYQILGTCFCPISVVWVLGNILKKKLKEY
jgi:hypothetical protein